MEVKQHPTKCDLCMKQHLYTFTKCQWKEIQLLLALLFKDKCNYWISSTPYQLELRLNRHRKTDWKNEKLPLNGKRIIGTNNFIHNEMLSILQRKKYCLETVEHLKDLGTTGYALG